MVVGESFELGIGPQFPGGPLTNISWNRRASGGGLVVLDNTTAPFHGLHSLRLTVPAATTNQAPGVAAVTNRGLGNGGMVFKGGADYTGYFFARADDDDRAVTVTVRLDAYVSPAGGPPGPAAAATTLASAAVVVMGTEWRMYNYSLTPTRSTTCEDIAFGSDPDVRCMAGTPGPDGVVDGIGAGHVCQRCGGELVVGIAGGLAQAGAAAPSGSRASR